MKMCWTDDPLADFHRHDAEQEAKLETLPECSECGRRIQDDYAFYINDEWIHEKCMNENYRKEVQPDF